MIYDCFTFAEELELLELRLRILDEVVDRFVLCEAPFTFRGEPKRLRFAEQAERFARWRHKIVHLVYPGPPDPDPWQNEWAQRDYLARGLEDSAPDDLILLGDCDEIPDPRCAARRPLHKRIVGHRHRHCVGYVNRISRTRWIGTRGIAYASLALYGTLSELRKRPEDELELIDDGWHFSSFGGPEVMLRKMKTYAHSEFDVPYYVDPRKLEVKYASEVEGEWVPFDDSFPPVLRDDRWSKYVWSGPTILTANETLALEHAHGCFAYLPSDAAAVMVVSAEPVHWEHAGRERFGARFLGVEPHLASLGERLHAGAWVVVDGLERESAASLHAARATGAGVIAYARNARSYRGFEEILGGSAFPSGRALGIAEFRTWTAGGVPDTVERIQTGGVFAPWSKMPEMLFEVTLGENLRFPQIARNAMADFLCHAFIFTFAPQGSLR